MNDTILLVPEQGTWLSDYGALLAWLPSVALLLLSLLSGWALYRLIRMLERRLGKSAPASAKILAHGFSTPLRVAGQAALLMAAVMLMPLPEVKARIMPVVTTVFQSVLIALAAWGFWRSAPLCRLLFRGPRQRMDSQGRKTLGRFMENIYRVVVAALALLTVLERCGLPVVSLIAGAGVAGLAVTLAAQSTLSNLIAGVTLVLERPFVMGDYIILGDMEGTVEDISFRATRLRTPDNMLVTADNSKVLSEYIQNASSRDSRLWTFNLLLTFDADKAHVEAFRDGLEQILRADAEVLPDTVQVTLDAFGDSGLDVSARLYVSTTTLPEFRAVKNRLNLQIMDLLERTGCELAYPTTMIHQAPRSSDIAG